VGDFALWVVAIFAVVLFLGSLLAHELAHSIVARRNGMPVTGITLWLLGGVAQLGGPMPSAGAELRVAAAGPATSVALGIGFFLVAVAGAASGLVSHLLVSAIGGLAFVNIVLAVFNLIPARPLDGGRILAGALWAIHGDQHRADITADPSRKVRRLRLYRPRGRRHLGRHPVRLDLDRPARLVHRERGDGEQRHARMSQSLGELRVRDVMTGEFGDDSCWVTVDAFADAARVRPTASRHLPVEQWEGGISGVVTLDALRAVPPEHRLTTRVTDVACRCRWSRRVARREGRRPDQPPDEGRVPFVLVFTEADSSVS